MRILQSNSVDLNSEKSKWTTCFFKSKKIIKFKWLDFCLIQSDGGSFKNK